MRARRMAAGVFHGGVLPAAVMYPSRGAARALVAGVKLAMAVPPPDEWAPSEKCKLDVFRPL